MPTGEYECALESRDCRGALRFARELWSRQFVLKHVASDVLARSSSHAALHRGHVVVSVDSVAVTGLSMRKFTELWVPTTIDTSTAADSTTHIVRFCDRRRAELETAVRKEALASSDRSSTTTIGSDVANQRQFLAQRDVDERIAQCQAWMWSHHLQDAEQALDTLLLDHDRVEPLVLVTRLEVALVRVLVSNDAVVAKRARQTAKQTLAWLQSFSELPTLSRASALDVRVALAEALLLSTALQFIAEKNVQGITEFRRCTAMYSELQSDLRGESVSAVDATASMMPTQLLEDFQTRLAFGLGLLQLASASARQGPERLRTVFSGIAGAPAQALDNLLRVSSTSSLRSAWATLALFHSASAVRLVEQGSADDERKYMSKVAHVQRTSLERYPHSVLHLWSASQWQSAVPPTDDPESTDAGLALLTCALALTRRENEPTHVLHFDAGFRFAVALDFDTATPLFMAICKSASAPSKLRGRASVFLAATFLFVAHDTRASASPASSSECEQLFSSVRLLLRSALRFLDEAKAKDAEAACLAQRVGCYLASSDSVLHLLPIEVLYVYCLSYAKSSAVASRKTDLARHKRALSYLDAFHVGGTSVAAMGLLQSRGKVIKLNASTLSQSRSSSNRNSKRSGVAAEAQAICEWSVLRTSVLLQLGELSLAQQQLATLEALLPQVRATSFVPALVVLYDLQIRLRQRLVHAPEPVDDSDDLATTSLRPATLSKALGLIESGAFEYRHLYAGKLKALLAVWSKTRE